VPASLAGHGVPGPPFGDRERFSGFQGHDAGQAPTRQRYLCPRRPSLAIFRRPHPAEDKTMTMGLVALTPAVEIPVLKAVDGATRRSIRAQSVKPGIVAYRLAR
jgi:hypothetical protein